MAVNPIKRPTIDELFEQVTPIADAVQAAAREALRHHKMIGNPVATWRDGRVVLVQPSDIVVPDAPRPAGEEDAA